MSTFDVLHNQSAKLPRPDLDRLDAWIQECRGHALANVQGIAHDPGFQALSRISGLAAGQLALVLLSIDVLQSVSKRALEKNPDSALKHSLVDIYGRAEEARALAGALGDVWREAPSGSPDAVSRWAAVLAITLLGYRQLIGVLVGVATGNGLHALAVLAEDALIPSDGQGTYRPNP